MTCEEAKKKDDQTKSESPGPMGSEMFEMMKKCCTGEEAFSDCSAMMKGMMETMRGHSCCAPKTKGAEPEEGEK